MTDRLFFGIWGGIAVLWAIGWLYWVGVSRGILWGVVVGLVVSAIIGIIRSALQTSLDNMYH